jgi:hypothetical protein
MNPAGLILITIGIFSFAGGFFNWVWFMKTRSARGVVNALRPAGARTFYMILGVCVTIFGILLMMDIFGESQ